MICPVGIYRAQTVVADILYIFNHIAGKTGFLLPIARGAIHIGIFVEIKPPTYIGERTSGLSFFAVPPQGMTHYEFLRRFGCERFVVFTLRLSSVKDFRATEPRQNGVAAAIGEKRSGVNKSFARRNINAFNGGYPVAVFLYTRYPLIEFYILFAVYFGKKI